MQFIQGRGRSGCKVSSRILALTKNKSFMKILAVFRGFTRVILAIQPDDRRTDDGQRSAEHK